MRSKPKTSALINADPSTGIRITSPGLEDTPERETVLRGSVDISCLPRLKIDRYYQREQLTPETNRRIKQAVEMGVDLPDITLGMRGDRFMLDEAGAIILLDDVYIIDGQQRVGTIKRHLQSFPADPVRIGAVVHFNTTVQREEVKFTALNLFRTNMSANVVLANSRHKHPLLAALYGLTINQPSFVMCGRVSWQQQPKKGEHLISASGYVSAALFLHGHLAATRGGNSATRMGMAADNLARAISIQVARDNVAAFWNVIDEAWGVGNLTTAKNVSHMRGAFLQTLAGIFSEHLDFWDGEHLAVPLELRKRLAKLNLQEPNLAYLCGSGGAVRSQLRYVLIEHLNYRLRKKLTPRRPTSDLKAAA